MEDTHRSVQYIRWLYELLLSLYCALPIIANEYVIPMGFSRLLHAPLLLFDRILDPLLGLKEAIFFGHTHNLSYASWYLLAAIFFVLLRILAQVRPTRRFLRLSAGVVAVAGPLTYSYLNVWSAAEYAPSRWWQWLEAAAAVACVFVYANRRRRFDAAAGSLPCCCISDSGATFFSVPPTGGSGAIC
jgi:hypothetical protein